MRNRYLLSTALCAVVLAAPTFADTDVNDTRTTGIRTSDINDGSPDNIIIGTGGRVTIAPPTDGEDGGTGPAVTIDSNNTVENNGIIEDTTGDDNAVGVRVVGGNEGGLVNNGRINITSPTQPDDEDNDGDNDGPFAYGENRVGILIDGNSPFVGDITNGAAGVINVTGNNSAGIRLLTTLDGTLANGGNIDVVGSNSYGIDLQGHLTGSLDIGGNIVVFGEGSSAIRIGNGIDGIFFITGDLQSSAYRQIVQPGDNFLNLLDDDDTLSSGATIIVGGSIGRGMFLAGPAFLGTNDSASVISNSTNPAILISAAYGPGGDIIISPVFIPADPNNEEAEDFSLDYGFVNQGNIISAGRFAGFEAVGIRLEGGMVDGQFYTSTIEGGFRNEGRLEVITNEGYGTAFEIGNGGILPLFDNAGIVTSTGVGFGATANGVVVLEGGRLPVFRNSGTFSAIATGFGSAYAIVDQSNTLGLIENSGRIFAAVGTTSTETPNEGVDDSVAAGEEEAVVRRIAIDVSRSNIDVTYRQVNPEDEENTIEPILRGDILFGSGNDTADLQGGFVDGDIYFGAGADQLTISNGAAFFGAIYDSDGQLSILVDSGQLEIQNETTLNLTEATFNDGSRLIFEVDRLNEGELFINASGAVTFNQGSTVTASLDNLIGEGAQFIVLEADELIINDTLANLQDEDAPYLYDTSLSRNPENQNQLVLTLRRKNAEELGMHQNRASAYEAAFAAWSDNEALGAAFAAINNQGDFFAAYDQLLPDYAASAIQFAVASHDSGIGALSSRLDAARRSPDDTGGIWVQEFGYFADRAEGMFGPGYRGQGVGIAAGIDRPYGPFYALGLNFVGAASEIEEASGVDEPMTALTGQFGAYGGIDFGGLFAGEFYAGLGADSFETERRVLIGSFDETATAEWTGYHYAASARFARDITMGRWYARPAVSIDYLRLFESSFTESGGGPGIDLVIDDRESSVFASTASLTVGAVYGSNRSWWSPQFRIGYRNDFGSEQAETNARFVGYNDQFTFLSEDLPGSGLIAGFALQAGSDYSTFSFDYDADVRDGFIRHTARVVWRLVF